MERMGLPDASSLVFGVVETIDDGRSQASFEALSEWMRLNCGVSLERRGLRSYQALTESVRAGKSDVAWLPPVVYARVAELVNALGHIARGTTSTYSSALVTLASSRFHDARDLAALAGARAGWVDPWSAAGYVAPRLAFARAGLDPARLFASEAFYGSHGDVLQALQRGECDVVGTHAAVTEAGLRVVATFESIPSDVIAARRSLPAPAYAQASLAFRKACSCDEGKHLVRAVFGGDDLREGVAPGHAAFRRAYERAKLSGLLD